MIDKEKFLTERGIPKEYWEVLQVTDKEPPSYRNPDSSLYKKTWTPKPYIVICSPGDQPKSHPRTFLKADFSITDKDMEDNKGKFDYLEVVWDYDREVALYGVTINKNYEQEYEEWKRLKKLSEEAKHWLRLQF